MPIWFAAFLFLTFGTSVPNVIGGLDPRSDKIARGSKPHKGKVEYLSWSSSPEIQADGTCVYAVYAVATQWRMTRVKIEGTELAPLDWSYVVDARLPEGQTGNLRVTFIDPLTRKEVEHIIHDVCPGRHAQWWENIP